MTLTALSPAQASATTRVRRLSGCKPTGRLHLGNLLGMIRPMLAAQYDTDSITMIADMHALTVEHDPARLREYVREQARVLLAAGIDPDRGVLYVQSDLPEHAGLHYILECATGYGEAQRMTQFKEKGAGAAGVRLSLLTYPVLMAADILVHDIDVVPVGDDQGQHLELTRTLATRFNARYGTVFTVPVGQLPQVAARVMDLADPGAKMGKTNDSAAGTIGLLDPPDVVRRKVMRAVTDTAGVVRHDRQGQPGVTNLLEIYQACAGEPGRFTSYGALKAGVVDAVVALLEPLQRAYAALPPQEVERILADGAERVRPRAAATLRRAGEAIGLRC
ncbi:tryptophan--tRNA ligase 1 [Catellatospora sp. TT07R-123]|uniref:tryptophan--tRNA ligase n=1 Tax=Catellatospora sp. TT07R-123 TaxID=2733863 RepID=UPI001B0F8CEA|nr:tryptophan--tRNA ligase [Catellatospora sp. TT07R-123]GHJ45430.1 tryptophan--tRNA ligase 1 [Catellatospora sp. TT07R-123]